MDGAAAARRGRQRHDQRFRPAVACDPAAVLYPGDPVRVSVLPRGWISARDTGGMSSRSIVHADRGCRRIRRAHARAVDLASVDPDDRSCAVTGLGRRPCCRLCWPAERANRAGGPARPPVGDFPLGDRATPDPAHALQADDRPIPTPPSGDLPLQPRTIETGWLAADVSVDRHAVHAVVDCTHALRATATLREVCVAMPEPVGRNAGWWHPPPAFGWIAGVGRRRLCRQCWPRVLAAGAPGAHAAARTRAPRGAAGSDVS